MINTTTQTPTALPATTVTRTLNNPTKITTHMPLPAIHTLRTTITNSILTINILVIKIAITTQQTTRLKTTMELMILTTTIKRAIFSPTLLEDLWHTKTIIWPIHTAIMP